MGFYSTGGMEMRKVFGLWGEYPEMKNNINKLLKPYNIRLKIKSSRDWGDQLEISVVETGLVIPVKLIEKLDALLDFNEPVTEKGIQFEDVTEINRVFGELKEIISNKQLTNKM
jgi:hypothetical protein